MTRVLPVRRALISVSNKEALIPFAKGLSAAGVHLVSTGSTGETLRSEGIKVTLVSEVTGFPDLLDGRVKTLHPAIHAAILGDKSNPLHLQELADLGIEPFDLVVVNLYPFEDTVAGGAEWKDAIEQIDIGGPALIRSAGKNARSVAVVVDPARYQVVLDAIHEKRGVPEQLRSRLATEAFEHVALYDAAIAAWFRRATGSEGLPRRFTVGFNRIADLRYGENPHQQAALYREVLSPGPLGGAEIVQGKQMSFNNWLDAEAARGLAAALSQPGVAIVKHSNPCGAAIGETPAEAYRAAYDSDKMSAFGGVAAFNSEVDEEAVRAMAEVFTEVIVAPGYTDDALRALAQRANLRVLRAPAPSPGVEFRLVEGGAVLQEPDRVAETRVDMKVVGRRQPDEGEWQSLMFAWTVAAWVKSNAVVLASGGATVGIGAAQMSRIDAVDMACRKAGERARGAVMASDAFFPFRDGVDRAAAAGVRAVIHPGGSVRDAEVIQAADEHDVAMVLTGRRHFRH